MSSRSEAAGGEHLSVVIPFFDQHDTLGAALSSLYGQAGVKEVIIVDDASGAPPVIDADLPVTVIRHDRNRGPAAARNSGVDAAKNAFVAFLDADDEWLPNKSKMQVEALSASGALGCLSGYFIVRRSGGEWRAVAPPAFCDGGRRAFLGGWIGAAGSTLMLRRDVFRDLGGYDESLRHFEDWDLLLRASRAGRFAVVECPLSLTVQLGSPPGPLQATALAGFARKHLPIEHGRDRRRLAAALAYERASMHYRRGERLALLRPLMEAMLRQPLHSVRRVAGRMLGGIP